VLSAGAPAAQQLVVVGYRRKVPILTGYSYEVCWHWSTKAGEGWEPIYGCLSDGEQSADQGAPAVPMQDEQDSSVHLASDDSSRALRAASQETPQPVAWSVTLNGHHVNNVFTDLISARRAKAELDRDYPNNGRRVAVRAVVPLVPWPIQCDGVTASGASSEAAKPRAVLAL
jgi:hypothetical protein